MMQRVQRLAVVQPVAVLVSAFLALISAVSVLIFLFELSDNGISYVNAFFTSASASTVTGLTILRTNTLSLASQVAILGAIQLGGLMTYLGAYVILKVAGMRGRSTAELVAQIKWKDVKLILIFSFLAEVFGAVGYFLIFHGEMNSAQAVYYAIFHSVSAYCNAGFFLFTDNFYSASPLVMGIAMAETVLGGLGFVTITGLWNRILATLKRERPKVLSLETRIMLMGTALLIIAGTVGFWGLEHGGLLEGKSLGGGALISLFQSVSARTAGFSSVDFVGLNNATYLLLIFLMFVGAGSVSVAGGVKITTLAIVLLASLCRDKRGQVIVAGQEIPPENSSRALQVIVWYGIIIVALMLALLVFEPQIAFRDILFEGFSAAGTVGLSTGITAKLSIMGKLILIAMMLFGRTGPFILAYVFIRRSFAKPDSYTYRKEVNVG